MDLVVEVPAVNPADLSLLPPGKFSADVATRVAAAQARQRMWSKKRAASTPPVNAQIDGRALEEIAIPSDEGRKLLADAASAFGLTAGGYHRVLRVGRTIADIEGVDIVERVHIVEALSYRRIQPGREKLTAVNRQQGVSIVNQRR